MVIEENFKTLLEGLLNLKEISTEELLFGVWLFLGIKTPPFLLLLVVAGITLGLIPLFSLIIKTTKLGYSIDRINRQIKNRNLPRTKLKTEEFEEVSKVLENSIVASSWNEFKETVVQDSDGHIYNTRQAEEFFSKEKIISTKLNLELYSSIPSLATSFGLVLTFIAILLGLSKVSISDTGQVNGMAELVSSLSGKFISSIAALLFALIYTFFQKWCLGGLNSKILHFSSYLNGFFPRQAAECFLRDIHSLSASIDNSIKDLKGDLVEKFSQAFQVNTVPTLTKMSTCLEKVDSSINQMNALLERSETNKTQDMNEMLAHLAETFQSNLSNAARAEFDRLSDSLSEVSTVLEKSSSRADDMINGVSKMITKMDTVSYDHAQHSAKQLRENANQISGLISELGNISQSSANSFAKEMNITLSKIKTTGEIQLQSAKEQSESMQQTMRESFSELSRSLSISVKDMFDRFSTSINTIVDDLEKKGDQLTDKLEQQGSEAENKYKTKVANVDQKLAVLLSGFEATQEQVMEFVRISKSNNDIGVQGLKEAEEVLNRSAKSFTEIINRSSSVMNNFTSFANTVKSASGALEVTLSEIIEVEKAASKRIEEARKQDNTLNDSVREYSAALESSKEVLASYKKVLTEVDGGLGGILAEINGGLESYSNAISRNLSDHIGQWDQAFSRGYSNLNSSVQDLTSSIEDLVEKHRQS